MDVILPPHRVSVLLNVDVCKFLRVIFFPLQGLPFTVNAIRRASHSLTLRYYLAALQASVVCQLPGGSPGIGSSSAGTTHRRPKQNDRMSQIYFDLCGLRNPTGESGR